MLATLLVLILCSQIFAAGQDLPVLTDKNKANVIDSLASALNTKYFFTEKLDKIVKNYRKAVSNGEYKKITNPNEMADKLTADFHSVTKDIHFRVMYNPVMAEALSNTASSSCGGSKKDVFGSSDTEKMNNYGFKEVKILPGNVGYLRLDHFSTSYEAYEKVIQAMNFLENTQALIVDMRYNNGGSAALVQFMITYLVEAELPPVLLNTLEMRGNKMPTQSWTLPYVPGKRISEAPVYVLTSRNTGSASEAFSYFLQNLQRATIVGETTAGAAHPVTFASVGSGFVAIIPIGKISNPLTGTDWETQGVIPNIPVEGTKALDTSYKMILDSLLSKTEDPEVKAKLEWALDGLAVKLNPTLLAANELGQFAGVYGQRTISFQNNKLFYKRFGPEAPMYALKKDLFGVEGMDNFRIKFERDKSGKVNNLIGMYEEGRTDNSPKTQ